MTEPNWGDAVDALGTPNQPAPTTLSNDQPQATAPANQNVSQKTWLDAVDQYGQTNAQASVLQDNSNTPDQVADAEKMSRSLDVPRETILNDPGYYKQQNENAQNSAILANSPVVSAWLADNIGAAQIAKDDFQHLDTIGKLTATLVQSVQQPLLENKLGRAGSNRQAIDLTGANPAENQADIDKLKGEMTAYSQFQPTGMYQKSGAVVSTAVNLLDNAIHALPELAGGAAIGAGVGGATSGVGAVPGAVVGAGTGFKTGMALDMARVAGGQTYLQMLDARDANGQPLSPVARQIGASTVAGLTFGIGFGGLGIQSKAATQAINSFVRDSVGEALARPTVVSAIGKVATNVGVGALEGGVMMGAMAASQQAGQEIAKGIDGGQWQNVVNSPELRQQYIGQIGDAFQSGALMFGLLHGFGGIASEYGRYQQSQLDMSRFSQLEQESSESKTRQRDPDTFADFLRSQTDNSPVENLYVPAEKVRALYQSMNSEPGADNDPFAFQKDMKQQLDQAQAIGGDVVIPTSDYLAHLAGTDVSTALRDDIRPRPDGYSVNEARVFHQSVVGRLQDLARQAADDTATQNVADSSTSEVRADVTKQLTALNRFTPEQVDQYATLYASRYEARGERLGKDPMALYRENPLTITNEAQETGDKNFSQGPRGQITFNGTKRTIGLFKQADTSTLLHESGHLWLEEMHADSLRPDAPEQVKDDWNKIANWIGHEGDGDIKTPAHEKFATAIEKYFMEGKAPTLELRGAFQRFKDWLLNIYKQLANGKLPELNDDIRDVFDRMIATDDAIKTAQQAARLDPMFADAKTAKMTDAEFAAYQKIVAKARQSASAELLDKTMAGIRKERTAEFKKSYQALRPEVEKEINARRDIRALHFLRTGRLLDATEGEKEIPKMKLDNKTASELLGNISFEELERRLPNGVLSKGSNGVHPDDAAALLGYDSGKKMLTDLAKLRNQENALKVRDIKKPLREYLTDRDTKAQVRDKEGDLLNDESISDEAQRAIHGANYGDMIAAEVAAMARQIGEEAIPYKVALQWARGVINDKKLSDATRLHVYDRAEAKAGDEALQAALNGDMKTAYFQKQTQMMNHALSKAADEARDDLVKGKKLFDRFANNLVVKSVDQAYTDQIHGLLQRFAYGGKRKEAELERALSGSNLRDFVQEKFENGRELSMADWLYSGNGKPVQDFTTQEYRDLKDAVESLAHVGREEKTLNVDGKKMAKDEVMQEIIGNIKSTQAERESSGYLNKDDAGKVRGALDRFTSFLRATDAELLKPEQMLNWLDQRDVLGPLNKHIFRPIKEAQVKEFDLLDKISKSFRDMDVPDDWHKTLSDKVENDTLIDPETQKPAMLSRKTMLAMAMNTGNDSNMERLLGGYKWSPEDVRDFLYKNMQKADWDFVQHAWDTFDMIKPDIDDMQRRLTGVGLDLIEPKAVKTPFGDYKGGYYPIVYDPEFSKRGMASEAMSGGDNIFEKDYYRPTTPKGHTMARVQNYSDRILLSMDVLPSKLKQAVHDLAFREAIINADKILADPKFKSAIRDTWGIEYFKQFRPWLRDVANAPNVDDRPLSFLDKALRYSRMTMVEMGIGFRVTTMMKHGSTAFANSIGEIGGKDMAAGMAEYYSDRAGKRAFVYERSGEMRHRMTQYDRDVRENLGSLMGEDHFLETMRRFGHYGVSFLDMESAMPTWIGAYRAALRNGVEEKDAVYSADKAVRNAHGSQTPVDTAPIQRGPEYKKMFSMFYGFFNHMYNRERDTYRIGKDGFGKLLGGDVSGAKRDFVTVLARSMAYLLAPALVEASVSGTSKSDDESWTAWASKAVAGQLAATVPLVRDVGAALEYGKGPESPLSRFITAMAAQAKDIQQVVAGSDPSRKWVKHAIETPGYLLGAPTGQLATGAQYIWDVHQGNADPEDIEDWMHGLVYGKDKK